MSKPVGHPTKYRPEMCERIIELMKEGASKYEVALELDICEDSFYEYMKKFPEFSEAVKKGNWFSRGSWEKEGRINLHNKEFNTKLYDINMKNRFGWSDKKDVKSESINNIIIDDTSKKLEEIRNTYKKEY